MAVSGTQKPGYQFMALSLFFFLPSQPPFPFGAKDTVAVHQLIGSWNHYNPGNLGHIYHLLHIHTSCPFLSERRHGSFKRGQLTVKRSMGTWYPDSPLRPHRNTVVGLSGIAV